MTDREKLLIALLSENADEHDGKITVLEVAAMLCELGDDYRRRAARGSTCPPAELSPVSSRTAGVAMAACARHRRKSASLSHG